MHDHIVPEISIETEQFVPSAMMPADGTREQRWDFAKLANMHVKATHLTASVALTKGVIWQKFRDYMPNASLIPLA
jgi:hypothetical protein